MNALEDTQVARTLELNDGTRMPALGLGTWKSSKLPRTSVQGAVETAISAGYRHIDTAYNYRNEIDVGKALRSKMQQGIIRREDMFIVSKKMGDEMYPMKDGIIQTTDIDYIDVWRGMEQLQASGKVKSIGVSNFSILQLERLLALCKVPPAVNQVEIHPYLAQTEMIEFCKAKNIVLTAYSPFGSPGRPPVMIREDTDPNGLLQDPVVTDIAKKHKCSPAQVLLRYHVQQGVSVIPKSDKSHHILENTKIFDLSLTEEDMRDLRGLDRGWKSGLFAETKSHPYYPFL